MKKARWVLSLVLFVSAFVVVGGPRRPPDVAAYPADTVDLIGHGWGHGRGMGQFGALGYAVNHSWSYQQILGHFYSNTTPGNLPGDVPMSVRMTGRDGADTIVFQSRGNLRMGHESNAVARNAALVRRTGPGQFSVWYSPERDCNGPWPDPPQSVPASEVVLSPGTGGEDPGDMLELCEESGSRVLRGSIRAVDAGGTQVTVNHLNMEGYLKGVVPRESPASWGDVGEGRGMQALLAQAVAARSYSATENRFPYARTCDTITCQVYGGRGFRLTGAGVIASLEDPRTNQAIDATATQVRMMGASPARTEFSSSTGGYSAGGTFPAVPDEGDSISSNPNHTWTAKIPVSTIEARWGFGKGTLNSVDVTQRNGLGADGGRVIRLMLRFAGGDVEVSGEDFRRLLGLKSNWFRVANAPGTPYHVLTRDGGVFAFGGAHFHGSLPGINVRTPARDMAETAGGYWIMGEDGGVFSFGAANFYGSMGGKRLNQPVVGMASTNSGQGYWLVASDGGIFAFGDARFFGSTGSLRLNQPMVGMAPTPTGGGYWLVASDGGIFAFGDAKFYGSTGSIKLNQPVVGMASTADGGGYWLAASDGGLFAFGNARFHGSLPGRQILERAVDMQPSGTGEGYLIATAEGRVHAFGDAVSRGGPSLARATSPTVALAIAR